MSSSPPVTAAVSLSEVLAALSYALDLTEGQPAGHTLRSCVIGMRLAGELGLDAETRSALYYALLMKDAGCSANAAGTARLFGVDDRAAKRALKTVNWTQFQASIRYGLAQAAAGRGLLARIWHMGKVAVGGRRAARELVRLRCDRGAEIVAKLGFPDQSAQAVRCLDEHWDGSGHPDGRRGDDVPLLARIALVAQTVDVFAQDGGVRDAVAVLEGRRGTWFDPQLVAVVARWKDDRVFWDAVFSEQVQRLAVEAEPVDQVRHVDSAGLDRVAEGFADVIDAKSPYTSSHSRGVAHYARELGGRLGLDTVTRHSLYRAGLLHDIGKLAISNRILDKTGTLTSDERRAVEAHPVFTWTILSQIRAFASIAATAALHHERLDGRGYPWGYTAEYLDRPARILSAADVYEALTAERPYRGALAPQEALRIMREDVGKGLDGEVVEALAADPPARAGSG